ncbi:DUF1292 domain-containing protein [Mechercharimyces sp. CAU 1602]|uniref:DUF1292 domain-containing protein n=1 Tax=Mechercharimyces sp. CAU 1602 TaxID=2973933 RepID=UPI0021638980|nr:DUF1292 domain-containing protein [Mechercharimyces sp. CAU 1602]MCS1350265.1 DUF1292 domain-containing protein [Mechercharimyces sp. CAU 1602]
MRTNFKPSGKRCDHLRQKYGSPLLLSDYASQEEDQHMHLLDEIEVDNKHYAVMQPLGGRDGYLFFVDHQQESLHLHHIEDEGEWEQIAEVVDEMLCYDEYSSK